MPARLSHKKSGRAAVCTATLVLAAGWAVAGMGGAARGQIVTPGGAVINIQPQPVVETLQVGTAVGIGATVSADRRYVLMNLNLSLSNLDGLDTFVTGSGVGTVQSLPISNGGGGGVGSQSLGAMSRIGGGGFMGGAGSHMGFGTASAKNLNLMPSYLPSAKVPYRPSQIYDIVFVDHDHALLEKPVAAMSIEKTTLKDISQKIAKLSGANITFGWNALKDAGINPNTLCSVKLPEETLKKSLIDILNSVAPSTPLVVKAEDNVIYVTSQAQADHDIVTKTYWVEDLLGNIPRYVSSKTNMVTGESEDGRTAAADALDADNPQSNKPVSFTASGEPVAPNTRGQKAAMPPINNICDLITHTIRPEIWKSNGGKYGSITQVNNKVIITAPESVQSLFEGGASFHSDKPPLYIGVGG